jgi:hypothetical protein
MSYPQGMAGHPLPAYAMSLVSNGGSNGKSERVDLSLAATGPAADGPTTIPAFAVATGPSLRLPFLDSQSQLLFQKALGPDQWDVVGILNAIPKAGFTPLIVPSGSGGCTFSKRNSLMRRGKPVLAPTPGGVQPLIPVVPRGPSTPQMRMFPAALQGVMPVVPTNKRYAASMAQLSRVMEAASTASNNAIRSAVQMQAQVQAQVQAQAQAQAQMQAKAAQAQAQAAQMQAQARPGQGAYGIPMYANMQPMHMQGGGYAQGPFVYYAYGHPGPAPPVSAPQGPGPQFQRYGGNGGMPGSNMAAMTQPQPQPQPHYEVATGSSDSDAEISSDGHRIRAGLLDVSGRGDEDTASDSSLRDAAAADDAAAEGRQGPRTEQTGDADRKRTRAAVEDGSHTAESSASDSQAEGHGSSEDSAPAASKKPRRGSFSTSGELMSKGDILRLARTDKGALVKDALMHPAYGMTSSRFQEVVAVAAHSSPLPRTFTASLMKAERGEDGHSVVGYNNSAATRATGGSSSGTGDSAHKESHESAERQLKQFHEEATADAEQLLMLMRDLPRTNSGLGGRRDRSDRPDGLGPPSAPIVRVLSGPAAHDFPYGQASSADLPRIVSSGSFLPSERALVDNKPLPNPVGGMALHPPPGFGHPPMRAQQGHPAYGTPYGYIHSPAGYFVQCAPYGPYQTYGSPYPPSYPAPPFGFAPPYWGQPPSSVQMTGDESPAAVAASSLVPMAANGAPATSDELRLHQRHLQRKREMATPFASTGGGASSLNDGRVHSLLPSHSIGPNEGHFFHHSSGGLTCVPSVGPLVPPQARTASIAFLPNPSAQLSAAHPLSLTYASGLAAGGPLSQPSAPSEESA